MFVFFLEINDSMTYKLHVVRKITIYSTNQLAELCSSPTNIAKYGELFAGPSIHSKNLAIIWACQYELSILWVAAWRYKSDQNMIAHKNIHGRYFQRKVIIIFMYCKILQTHEEKGTRNPN